MDATAYHKIIIHSINSKKTAGALHPSRRKAVIKSNLSKRKTKRRIKISRELKF